LNRVRTTLTRLYAKEAKETFWSFATKGATALLFVALNAYLARTLGVDLWGSWSFLLSNLTIVFLLSYLGLNNAARAYAARYSGTPQLQETLKASLLLRIAISAAFTTAFVLLAGRIAGWVQRPELAGVFRLAAPLVFLMGFLEYLKQIFTGLHRLVFHFIVNLLEFGGKIVLVVVLLSMAVSLENVVLAHWLAAALATGVGFIFWLRFYHRAGEVAVTNGSGSLVGPLFQYSLPLFLISIGFLVLTEIDTLMLGLLAGDYEVGLFSVGKQLANKLPQFALALSMGTMPGFARLNAGNLAEMRQKYLGILRLNALVFLPGGLLLVLLAPWFVPLIFGEAYRQSVLPLQILTVWIVLTSFNMFFNALLDYQGLARRRAFNFTWTIAATVLLNLYMIPRYGAVGAAISTSLAYGPYVILNGLEARRVFEKSPESS
jgi:O-antigen/teichoic acid export membrane protein